jgi:hypothetical protein
MYYYPASFSSQLDKAVTRCYVAFTYVRLQAASRHSEWESVMYDYSADTELFDTV